ncbi:MAG: methyltransferase [Myxococcales bacterium]
MTLSPKSTPSLHPDAPEEPAELGPLSDDAITGSFRIFQRVHGHRYSLDDVITAWEAASVAPHARQCLELGSGIGSVLLMLAYKLPDARFVAVEAQRNSFELLTRNIARNELGSRVRPVFGDLRAVAHPELSAGGFDLITGTPPYVAPGTATPSTDAQRAYARQEFRGGVEDYLLAGGRCLKPGGRMVVCADARFPERVLATAATAGLTVLRRRDVIPRASEKAALFSVFTLGRADSVTSEVSASRPEHSTWIARDAGGARSESYLAVRAFFGLSAPSGELPSP